MTETNVAAVDTAEKKEVTVSWRKMTDGIGLVFAGVISMLEALDAGTARDFKTIDVSFPYCRDKERIRQVEINLNV